MTAGPSTAPELGEVLAPMWIQSNGPARSCRPIPADQRGRAAAPDGFPSAFVAPFVASHHADGLEVDALGSQPSCGPA